MKEELKESLSRLVVSGLNDSSATETVDDHRISRCNLESASNSNIDFTAQSTLQVIFSSILSKANPKGIFLACFRQSAEKMSTKNLHRENVVEFSIKPRKEDF